MRETLVLHERRTASSRVCTYASDTYEEACTRLDRLIPQELQIALLLAGEKRVGVTYHYALSHLGRLGSAACDG